VLVPLTSDDLPGDQDGVPFIEVGGPRPKAPAGPQLMPPRPAPIPPAPDVAFHLLPKAASAAAPPPPPDLIAYHRPDHPAARQYRLLADGIGAQHPGGRPPVLLFTSASVRTAGTATVANLAVTRAADGYGRVLVIEPDRGPGSAAERFGIPPVPGLRELLARTIPLGMALHRTGVDGVYLVPAGKTEVGTDEALRLPALLDQLRGRFEWILVDAPVWGTFPLTDWARCADGVYLVLRPDEWDSPQAEVAHDGIARAGGSLRGCVTTQEAPPAPPVVPLSFPELKGAGSADGHGRGDQVVEHVVPPVGVPRRRLRVPHVVRRPGDD
jgi:Mrp family chromosome partitioning ATPase